MTINNDDKYIAAVQVNTIGVEKANTIAIYETNGTVFNGHYHEQERMNIIQLYINDSGDDTPFEAGLNTIVIPTSLFTETLFNAYVQNESLSETPIYSSDEETFKFISVGRDGNTEQACDEIDFVIIRFDMSSADGMEILDLLLTCLVNETSNETAVVYSYVSTKLNDTSAVMMSLPISVLQYVPWFCNFCDSLMGEKPETFGNWFWKSLNKLVNLIIGVIIAIVMAIVELITLIIDFFIYIFMDVLPILGHILWLIIRVAILIFAWIVFAIALLILTALIGIFALVIYPIAILLGWDFSYNIINLKTGSDDMSIELGYEIYLDYNEFFDLWLPLLYFYLVINGVSIIEVNIKSFPPTLESLTNSTEEENPEQSSLKLSNQEENLSLINSSDDFSNDDLIASELGDYFDETIQSPRVSSGSSKEPYNAGDIIDTIISGMDDGFGLWSFIANMAIFSITISTILKDNVYIRLIMLISPIIVFFSMMTLSLIYKQYTKFEYFLYLIGIAITSVISSFMIYQKAKPKSRTCYTYAPCSIGGGTIKELFGQIREINKIKEFTKDIILDTLGFINDVIWPEGFFYDFFNWIGDGVMCVYSMKDWYNSFKALEGATNYLSPTLGKSKWEENAVVASALAFLGTAFLTIIAFSFYGALPKANFVADSTVITQGDTINFTYTGFENYQPHTYLWDFGDGFTSTLKNPSHKYNNNGSFTVSLTIIDRDGDFDIETKQSYITVNE